MWDTKNVKNQNYPEIGCDLLPNVNELAYCFITLDSDVYSRKRSDAIYGTIQNWLKHSTLSPICSVSLSIM